MILLNGQAFVSGTFFKMTPTGVVTVLFSSPGNSHAPALPCCTHSYRAPTPTAGDHKAVNGVLYGTTSAGGVLSGNSPGAGTVFSLRVDGSAFTTLHTFAGGADGATPMTALVPGVGGSLFGTTRNGGPSNAGTVFEMSPAGDVTILHAFTGTNGDGANPATSLVPGTDGSLYGTTDGGGASGDGTADRAVFRPAIPGSC